MEFVVLKDSNVGLGDGNVKPLIIISAVLFGIVDNHGLGAGGVDLAVLGGRE